MVTSCPSFCERTTRPSKLSQRTFSLRGDACTWSLRVESRGRQSSFGSLATEYPPDSCAVGTRLHLKTTLFVLLELEDGPISLILIAVATSIPWLQVGNIFVFCLALWDWNFSLTGWLLFFLSVLFYFLSAFLRLYFFFLVCFFLWFLNICFPPASANG